MNVFTKVFCNSDPEDLKYRILEKLEGTHELISALESCYEETKENKRLNPKSSKYTEGELNDLQDVETKAEWIKIDREASEMRKKSSFGGNSEYDVPKDEVPSLGQSVQPLTADQSGISLSSNQTMPGAWVDDEYSDKSTAIQSGGSSDDDNWGDDTSPDYAPANSSGYPPSYISGHERAGASAFGPCGSGSGVSDNTGANYASVAANQSPSTYVSGPSTEGRTPAMHLKVDAPSSDLQLEWYDPPQSSFASTATVTPSQQEIERSRIDPASYLLEEQASSIFPDADYSRNTTGGLE